MDDRFSCRVELTQHMAPSGRAVAFAQTLEPFEGNVMRLPDGRVYVDVVVPARDLREAVAQAILLVTYAARQAHLPDRAIGVIAHPLAEPVAHRADRCDRPSRTMELPSRASERSA